MLIHLRAVRLRNPRFLAIFAVSVFAATAWAVAAAAVEVPFSPAQTIDSDFTGAQMVATADVDGDGDLDVVGAAATLGDIVWWENTAGDGSAWTEHSIDASFAGAGAVAVADVDGDGDIDVLGAARIANDIAWWENTAGDGSAWIERTVDGSFNGAIGVAAADVDGDGDMDVLGAGVFANQISWWENTAGTGLAWTEHPVDTTFGSAISVTSADVDGDGDTDVLGAALGDNDITWWENTIGDGSMWTERTIDSAFLSARAVASADVDGDGDLDVLAVSSLLNDVVWWENANGDGTQWTEHAIGGGFGGPQSVAVADLDGDGDVDVLVAATGASTVIWWENTGGDGMAWTPRTIDGAVDGAVSAIAADVDGDGDLDVVAGAGSSADITWWQSETLHRSAVFPFDRSIENAFGSIPSAAVADLDGDGDTDVLGASSFPGEIAWWENDAGDGSSWPRMSIDASFAGVFSVGAADVDGDGDLDVMGAGVIAGEVAWWENTVGDASAWMKRSVDPSFAGAQEVASADIDGDGDVDILGVSPVDDVVVWWENTAGDGTTWTEISIDAAFDGADAVAAADVDGDGDLDVLGAAADGDEVAWWENTVGDGSAWTDHVIDAAFPRALSVAAADVDADGDLDVLGVANEVDEVAWWENTAGDGSAWTKRTIDDSFDGAIAATFADLDDDGDVDVLGAAASSDQVRWWENTAGDGTAWVEHLIDPSFTGAVGALAVDLNRDGDLDALVHAVGVGPTPGRVSWRENRGGQFALPTVDLAPERVTAPVRVAVLEITGIHRGRAGDGDAELVALELLLTDGAGTPLTSTEADDLLIALLIYLDDGDGILDPGFDIEITFASTFPLTDGVLTILFADGDPSVQLARGTPRTFFVEVLFESDASLQSPDDLRITHLTESSSSGEDAEHDLPIVLELAVNTSSTAIEVNDAPEARPDTFVVLGGDLVGNVLTDNGSGEDADEEGDPLTTTLIDPPTLGTLVDDLGTDGSFIYLPNPGTFGVDTFTYQVDDGFGGFDQATVTITILDVIFADGFESSDASAWSMVVP